MIQVASIAGECVAVASSVDAPPTKFLSLRVRQVPPVALVENAIRECAARAHREQVTLQTRAIRIDIEDGRASFVPAADHGTLEEYG
jgi:hypothetical protein